MSHPVYTTASTPATTAAHDSATNSRPPQPSSSTATTAPAPALAKPPTDIHPTAHLDSSAYVLGTHPISLAPSVLIHPRARLISTHGPLLIDSGTVISERCAVGAPAPGPNLSTALSSQDPQDPNPLPLKTTIGASILLHPFSTIHAGATLHSFSIIEPHATILPGITIGAHAKVCAGVTVTRDVANWEVVFGNGQQRRTRAPDLQYEDVRLRALAADREGTMSVLKASAAKTLLLAKKKG